jgi:hypothetical protein
LGVLQGKLFSNLEHLSLKEIFALLGVKHSKDSLRVFVSFLRNHCRDVQSARGLGRLSDR